MSLLSATRDVGPHPVGRAVTGLLVGLAAGAIAALLIPRERDRAAPGTSPAGR